ncbi:DNA-binding protein [Candidatus Amarobacter glycogenicus]|uniref:type II toxin-antitoxin system VapC family toxin n=1 Tax=Candidatus Amarobacter glycogenicus TaxID=3140699 RepID=UPI0031CC9737
MVERQLDESGEALAINQIIFAEILLLMLLVGQSMGFSTAEYTRVNLPWEAAFTAARAFLLYRKADGVKTSPLPDFYIGAHALVAGLPVITRDAARYRTYFPEVELVAPD